MTDEKSLFKKFSSFMDQNIRGVQYGIYSVAGLGLIIALRSVRPFAKFKKPTDIPSHFLEKKMSFHGKVVRVDPSFGSNGNPLLIVDHYPLVGFSRKVTLDGLPLDVSSTKITGNGFLWMQSLLVNKDITFIPLRISSDRVHSIILNEKQNVGQQLVKIGFATVTPIDTTLENDQVYLKYYKKLLSSEKNAEIMKAGIWAGNEVPFFKFWMYKFKNSLPFFV